MFEYLEQKIVCNIYILVYQNNVHVVIRHVMYEFTSVIYSLEVTALLIND